MSRLDRQFNLRIPHALFDRLYAAAKASRRSMTAEVVHRLNGPNSILAPVTSFPAQPDSNEGDTMSEQESKQMRWIGLGTCVQQLVDDTGRIVADVCYIGGWRLGEDIYIDAASARAAAEKKYG